MTLPQYPECAKLHVATHEMRFDNIDQQAACLTGYDQRYQQVSCGKYHGWFRTVLLDEDVGLYFESFNQTLEQWGASPPDRYGFIFFMDPENFGHLGTTTFCGDDILFLPPGNGFDFRAPPKTSFCVVSIDLVAFDAILRGNLGRDRVLDSANRNTRIIRDADCTTLLRQVVAFLVRKTSQKGVKGIAAGALQGAKRSLLELTGGIVGNALETDSTLVMEDILSNEKVALTIRDFIRVRNGIRVGPAQLAKEFTVSRRSLEQIFRTYFSTSPAAYIHTIKLNAFRSALLAPQNRETSIGDVAATFEIWHLSRLAQSYRQQFGELPSESRKAASTQKG